MACEGNRQKGTPVSMTGAMFPPCPLSPVFFSRFPACPTRLHGRIRAKVLNRLFVSRDQDFGVLLFLTAAAAPGVIFRQITPADVETVHHEVQRLLQEQPEVTLTVSYRVVARHRYRMRRVTPTTTCSPHQAKSVNRALAACKSVVVNPSENQL